MLKKIKYYLLAFVIGIGIFSFISLISDFVPFGEYSFNIYDSFKMYISLLMQLKRTMFSSDVFYTLNAGLGVDFFNIKTLYMNSPLNILSLLFSDKYIGDFYTLLIYLRVGLATITMSMYLNSISKVKYDKKNILFALMYSLSTYYVALCYHIMWMDLFILLPLVIRGLDKLIDENRSLVYILFLSLAIIINFYLGYMICIFCLLYFIYRYLILDKKEFKVVKRFLVSSLLCGGIACVVLVPEILSLMAGRGNEFSFKSLGAISLYSLFSLFYSMLPGSYMQIDNLNDGSALIYSSILAIVLCILYFFNKKIRKKEKIITLGVILFFLLSFFINFIDYSWNMFQSPVWWSHRYAFVFVFFVVRLALISYEGLDHVVFLKQQQNIIIIIFSVLFIVSFSLKMVQISYYGLRDFDVLFLFLSLIIFVLYFYLFRKKAKFLMFGLLIFEIILNGFLVFCNNKLVKTDEVKEYLDNGEIIENVNNDFARVYYVDGNLDDGMLFNYKTATLFSSSYNNNVRNFLINKVGVFVDDINRIDFEFLNPAVMSLLNFKYIIGNSNYYFIRDDNVNVNNNNVLDMMFVVSEDFNDSELLDDDYCNNINKIYSDLVGEEVNLFYDVDNLSKIEAENFIIEDNKFKMDERKKNYSLNYSFEVLHEGVLLFKKAMFYEYFEIMVNGNVYNMRDQGFDGIVRVNKGDFVKISLSIYGEEYVAKPDITYEDLDIVILDDDKLNKVINVIRDNDLFYDLNDDNTNVISGKINSSKRQKVILTVPYQDGYKVLVDGKIIKYYDVYDTFVGFDIEEGEHEIEVSYFPPGLKVGFLLTLINLLGALFYVRKEISYRK